MTSRPWGCGCGSSALGVGQGNLIDGVAESGSERYGREWSACMEMRLLGGEMELLITDNGRVIEEPSQHANSILSSIRDHSTMNYK